MPKTDRGSNVIGGDLSSMLIAQNSMLKALGWCLTLKLVLMLGIHGPIQNLKLSLILMANVEISNLNINAQKKHFQHVGM